MSQRGLEWALRLRADLGTRITELREALAGIEPLRQELARLEEQLKGVERLVAVYHEQLGYPRREEEALAAIPPPQQAAPEAALAPIQIPEPPTFIAILRAEFLALAAACRRGAALTRETAARVWLSARVWVSERFSHGRAHS
jgi:hypothetical protein